MKKATKTETTKAWDIIIIGAGPAGSTAAMVLGRMRRSVLLIDDEQPRNARSQGMHNFLSRDGALPVEFLGIAHKELEKYSIEHIKTRATEAKKRPGGFTVKTADGNTYQSRRLLVASGVTDTVPDVPGMREFWGRGVYHCPFCDGWELCDKVIGLYAQRLNGYGMALALRHLSREVVLFTDGSQYLSGTQRRDLVKKGIQIVTQRLQSLQAEDGSLTCVSLRNGKTVSCDAVFVHHGHKTNNLLLMQLGAKLTPRHGAAVTNRKQQSSVQGLYVAGDAALDVHFVVVAAAEGAKAGVAIHDDLLKEDQGR
jgi:thioredoxin reductase